MERVSLNNETGSVSKKYQICLFAQLSITLLENVNFDHIQPIFNIEKPPKQNH